MLQQVCHHCSTSSHGTNSLSSHGLNVDGRLFIIGFHGGTIAEVNLRFTCKAPYSARYHFLYRRFFCSFGVESLKLRTEVDSGKPRKNHITINSFFLFWIVLLLGNPVSQFGQVYGNSKENMFYIAIIGNSKEFRLYLVLENVRKNIREKIQRKSLKK